MSAYGRRRNMSIFRSRESTVEYLKRYELDCFTGGDFAPRIRDPFFPSNISPVVAAPPPNPDTVQIIASQVVGLVGGGTTGNIVNVYVSGTGNRVGTNLYIMSFGIINP
jgi:hypothetical protein